MPPSPRAVMTSLAFGESPWHDGRLFASDGGAGEVLALDAVGTTSVVARASAIPSADEPRALVRMVEHHVWLTGQMVECADRLTDAQPGLRRPDAVGGRAGLRERGSTFSGQVDPTPRIVPRTAVKQLTRCVQVPGVC